MTNKIYNMPDDKNPRVPMAEHPFRHMVEVQMRFNDTDMLGHVNNSVYLGYFDLGKTQYFTDVAKGVVDWGNINIVVVNLNVDFFAPTFINEQVAVLTQVVSIGQKSLTMEQRLVNVKTGQVKCMARTVMAGIDLHTGQSQPIDADWVDNISTDRKSTRLNSSHL